MDCNLPVFSIHGIFQPYTCAQSCCTSHVVRRILGTYLPSNWKFGPFDCLYPISSSLYRLLSIPWEEELRCDWELCPRHRGRACSESLLQSLPLSRLMAAASLPLAGSGYITYLPDADLPAAAGGSLRIIPEPQQRVHFQINMDLNSSGIIPDALGSPGELVSALFPSEQFFVTRQPQNRIGLPQHTFVFKCMCLQGKLESTCDPNCDPVTCDLPGISETTEQLEHLDLQDQYLYPRYSLNAYFAFGLVVGCRKERKTVTLSLVFETQDAGGHGAHMSHWKLRVGKGMRATRWIGIWTAALSDFDPLMTNVNPPRPALAAALLSADVFSVASQDQILVKLCHVPGTTVDRETQDGYVKTNSEASL
ncbi:hypothetical protein MG293_002070 [Ovis ammon polii]|uniref:Uncharacterized protein n=1 Tax=Ovis ammon polii TaxID=230172 RepID=A0AAD4US96_OVIAM|nr:hypothetical protein MG293_002070 [Ovis ammon polii]